MNNTPPKTYSAKLDKLTMTIEQTFSDGRPSTRDVVECDGAFYVVFRDGYVDTGAAMRPDEFKALIENLPKILCDLGEKMGIFLK